MKYFQLNENENTTYQLVDAAKAVFRRLSFSTNACIRKKKKFLLTLKIKVNYITSRNEFIWEKQRIATRDKQAIAKAISKSNQ